MGCMRDDTLWSKLKTKPSCPEWARKYKQDKEYKNFVVTAEKLLVTQPWPHNGTGLRTKIRAMVVSPMDTDDLRAAFVQDIVGRHRGDVSTAADHLNMAALDLFRYLARHDIDLDVM